MMSSSRGARRDQRRWELRSGAAARKEAVVAPSDKVEYTFLGKKARGGGWLADSTGDWRGSGRCRFVSSVTGVHHWAGKGKKHMWKERGVFAINIAEASP